MSFIPPLPEIALQQEKEEKDSKSSQGEIIIYRGRNVRHDSVSIQRMDSAWSPVNQIIFSLSGILETDMNRMFAILPPAFTKMVNRIEGMLQRLESEKSEEEEECHQLMLYGQMEEMIHHFAAQRQQQLLLAGVSSGKELEDKKAKIAEYRALAEERYLRDSSLIEVRKRMDCSMITAYKGVLNEQDVRIIENYWNDVTHSSEGRSKMALMDARLLRLFVTSLINETNSMMEKMSKEMDMEEGETLKRSQYIVNYCNTIVQNIYQELEKEKNQCENPEEKLCIEYLILTGEPLMSTMLKNQKRQLLMPLLEEAEQEEKREIEFFKKAQQWSIDFCQGEIQRDQEKLQQAEKTLLELQEINKQAQAQGKSALEEDNWKIKRAKREIKFLKESLELSRTSLEKELVNQAAKTYIKSAHQMMKETPSEIRHCMPIETYFDQQMIEAITLDTQMSISQASELGNPLFSVSNDMQLDLDRLNDPVEYFYQKMIETDQKKLKLFQPKIELID